MTGLYSFRQKGRLMSNLHCTLFIIIIIIIIVIIIIIIIIIIKRHTFEVTSGNFLSVIIIQLTDKKKCKQIKHTKSFDKILITIN